MLMLATYNPSTGHVFELHGAQASDDPEENTKLVNENFVKAPEDACFASISTGHTLADMVLSFTANSLLFSTTDSGLPSSFVIKVSELFAIF
jgi:hypothetical protein